MPPSTEIVPVDSAPREEQASTSVADELTGTPTHLKPTANLPKGSEVSEVATRLGIDPVYDTDLLYIAEEFLLTPLPLGWTEYSNDDGRIYYFNEKSRATQWDHPLEDYYKGIVFMRKIGYNVLERKMQEHPPTPAEVREMAKYYGVNLYEEWSIIPFVKLTVNAPLPPEWEEYEEEDGSNCYVHVKTGNKSTKHPLDAYFLEVIRQKRSEVNQGASDGGKKLKIDFAKYSSFNDETIPEPWIEFYDKTLGKKFYFNFVANERTYHHPSFIMRSDVMQDASVLIQACARSWLARKRREDQKMSDSARVIQRSWNRRKERKEGRKLLEIMKYRDNTPQIVLIQRSFKKHLVEKRETEKKEADAAVKIQSHWRGKQARSSVPATLNRKKAGKLPDISMELGKSARSETLGKIEDSIQKMNAFALPPEPLLEPSLLQAESSNSTILSVKKLKPKPAKKRRKRRSTMVGGGRRASVAGGSSARRASIAGGRRGSVAG
ncbi:hypothetical protein HOP50_17g79900, partial [Chloropicon primus]